MFVAVQFWITSRLHISSVEMDQVDIVKFINESNDNNKQAKFYRTNTNTHINIITISNMEGFKSQYLYTIKHSNKAKKQYKSQWVH